MPAGAGRIGFWYLNQSQDIDFLADWMLLTYTFTDGQDLDTRTKIISPNIGGDYVGWGRGSVQASCLTFGGDNTGTGLESVLIDLDTFRTNWPSNEEITVDFRCMWYGSIGMQPIVLAAKLYKGGTMTKSGYTWIPSGTTGELSLNSQGKVVSYSSRSATDNGYHFANITYNVNTGIGGINTVDVADINETLSYIVDEK
jgi:hypothetical protein